MSTNPKPRYCDYYSFMSFTDFTAMVSGPDESHDISAHSAGYLDGAA
jgi:hypothetical protein